MTLALLSIYERDAFLQRRNPMVKLVLALTTMLVATFLFDPWTPGLIALLILATTRWLGRVPLPLLLRGMLPFLLLGLGYLWMNVLFPRGEREMEQILFHIGPLPIAREDIEAGLALTARTLCFGASSLFFVTTTAPTDLIRSLIHQAGLSPRLAFGILAAYRFLPLLEGELAQIRAAHRLRGVGMGRGPAGKVSQLYRYTIPLLANAIRKADRVAVAMQSRAFGGNRERSYFRITRIEGADRLLLGVGFLALILILLVSRAAGLLRLWGGGLGF